MRQSTYKLIKNPIYFHCNKIELVHKSEYTVKTAKSGKIKETNIERSIFCLERNKHANDKTFITQGSP